MANNICPVCGYPDLDDPAYWQNNVNGLPSYEICPSCGFQYGYTDDALHITFEQWREKWIREGMPWDGIGIKPPVGWNPREQLRNVDVNIDSP